MGTKNIEKRLKKSIKNKTKILGKMVREVASNLSFRILEIGARPMTRHKEPFYQFIDIFPGSQIIAFEVDKEICHQLNKKAQLGVTYYPVALGRTEQKCLFYETYHPMCSSLYKPNEKMLNMYNDLEVSLLKSISSVETLSLDFFIRKNNIGPIDFIKIDIQGAELDVFWGGVNTLKEVVAIVSEVEFVPLYLNQPLFGDVCAFLTAKGLMFHKFLDLAGRTLKPFVIGEKSDFATQHMWSDAVFIRDIDILTELAPSKLLKMGLLSYIYGSPDVTYQCFKIYDDKMNTHIHKKLKEYVM